MRKDYSFTVYLVIKAWACLIGYALGSQDPAFLWVSVASFAILPVFAYLENQGA